MGVRTGDAYVASLRDGRRVFIDGQVVTDVTAYGPFERVIATVAETYDWQHDPAWRELMTWTSPASGEPVSTTWLPARTLGEFQQRARCDYLRTDLTYGMMGRLTDFMSAYLLDKAFALELGGHDQEAARTRAFIDRCREQDLCITHALIDPQSDRSRWEAPREAVHVVERRSDGVVVAGARLLSTIAPLANECYVGPFYPRKEGEEDFALAFAVPMNAEGLKLVCRESFDRGRSVFDRPLSSRFDEGDAILVFDRVFVPEERLMVDGNIAAYNSIIGFAPGYTALQAASRACAKLRFLTGLTALVAHANGRAKTPRFQEVIGELVALVHIGDGLRQQAMHEGIQYFDAVERGVWGRPNPDPGAPDFPTQAGFAALMVFFPQACTRAWDALRDTVGSGGLAPTEADYRNPELKALLDEYLVGPGIDAERRLQLMKLAWDATGEQFGSRQALYERYYTGDPIRNRINWFGHPRREECEAMVRRLLQW